MIGSGGMNEALIQKIYVWICVCGKTKGNFVSSLRVINYVLCTTVRVRLFLSPNLPYGKKTTLRFLIRKLCCVWQVKASDLCEDGVFHVPLCGQKKESDEAAKISDSEGFCEGSCRYSNTRPHKHARLSACFS